MKITMLGVSGSGKTSYMAGLYEKLGVNSVEGFQLQPTIRSQELERVLAEQGELARLAWYRNGYKFPQGTISTTVWSLDLMHNHQPVLPFEWIDYRGGAINDLVSSNYVSDAGEILSHIIISDALVVFSDAFLLTYYSNLDVARAHSGMNEYYRIFSALNQVQRHKKLIFLIVLTKCDTVGLEWKSNNYAPLVQRGLEVFQPLIELACGNPHWTGGILPMSAVGEGKAERTLFEEGTLSKPPAVAYRLINAPAPINAEHVLFYCLGSLLLQLRDEQMQEIRLREAQILEVLNRDNAVKRFWAWLTGKKSAAETAKALRADLERTRSSLPEYDRYIHPLFKVARSQVWSFR